MTKYQFVNQQFNVFNIRMFSTFLNVLFTLVRSQNFVWFISVVCAGWEPEVLGTGNTSSLWKIFWNCIVYSLGVDGRLELWFFSLNLKCLSLLPFSNGWRVLVWETETKCFEEKQICLDTLLKFIVFIKTPSWSLNLSPQLPNVNNFLPAVWKWQGVSQIRGHPYIT